MSCADLFDLNKVKPKDRERYGPGNFGMHTLLARNLVENGAPFVMVSNGMPWDCHVFQHEVYQMLVPEVDRIIFNLITDLEERGLLDKTLVVMMGEFGSTPWLNPSPGRDHYPDAWSLAMAGAGIKKRRGGRRDRPRRRRCRREAVRRERTSSRRSSPPWESIPYAEYDEADIATFYRVEDHAEPIREILK